MAKASYWLSTVDKGPLNQAITVANRKRAIPPSSAIRTVNGQGYKTGETKYRINCQKCVVAYEMQRRGFDVQALPTEVNNNGRLYLDSFENIASQKTSFSSYNTVSQLESTMKSYGPGARGIIYVKWQGRNQAHVFNVENVRGEIKYYDAQTGKQYSSNTVLSGAVKNRTKLYK